MRSLQQMVISMAALTLLTLASFSTAQAADIRPFDRELAFSFNFEDNDDQSLGNLDLRLGWALSSAHQVGLAANIIYSDNNLTGSSLGGEFGPFYTRNFSTLSRTSVPYIGIQALTPFSDLKDTRDWSWKGYAGFRYLPVHNTSFNFGIFYRQVYTVDNLDPDSFGLEGGISVFF